MASYLSLRSLLSNTGPTQIEIVPEMPDFAILDVIVLILLVFTLAIIYIVIMFRGHYDQLAPLKIVQFLPRGRWTRENTIQQLPTGAPATLNRYGYHFHPHRPMALECVICLENFKEDDIVLSLPCDHDFHVECMYAHIIFLRYIDD
jgi:RING-like zinc finger